MSVFLTHFCVDLVIIVAMLQVESTIQLIMLVHNSSEYKSMFGQLAILHSITIFDINYLLMHSPITSNYKILC